jgi:uncharacterized protein (DUF433 family)
LLVTAKREVTLVKDLRFDVPLYTVGEAARILDVPATTFRGWVRGYVRHSPGRPDVSGDPIVSALPPQDSEPTVPFIGIAEGVVLAAIRRQGVPLQRIRPALDALQSELGIKHALASRKLYTDGAELLFDFAPDETRPAVRELVVVRNGQRVFTEIVESYLRRITFAPDGWAERITLPQYGRATVIADPRFSFGQPTFARGRARVADVLERFWAGEDLDSLAGEFGIPGAELEDAVRVASRRAA